MNGIQIMSTVEMTTNVECDICGEDINRTKSMRTRYVRDGKHSMKGKPSLRRRIVRKILGPVLVWKEWTNERGSARMSRVDICQRCRSEIRKSVQENQEE